VEEVRDKHKLDAMSGQWLIFFGNNVLEDVMNQPVYRPLCARVTE
jgi:hypothetical protein